MDEELLEPRKESDTLPTESDAADDAEDVKLPACAGIQATRVAADSAARVRANIVIRLSGKKAASIAVPGERLTTHSTRW
ncbi:hypothetical protein GCM10009107_10320 [Ideonella azotifigens]|uniref:Uncharacterized protein n=1 Tax=Ideonella azotifigens TaxID=513160 RepID=A0ABP3UXV2_9BURK